MADKDQPAKKQKRVVKSPETFRERAIKASVEIDKPKKTNPIRSVPAKVIRPITNPTAVFLVKLFKVQPFKFIGWVAKWIGKIIFPSYFRNSLRELRLVTWPNWKQSRQLTYAVLAFAIVFGGVIALVDYGLDKVFKQILLK